MPDVVVVGGVFREVLLGRVGRVVRLAGSGMYAAFAAARAGAEVTLVAPIGDQDRRTAQALCDGVGVKAEWLSVGPESATLVMDSDWWRQPRPQYKPAGAPEPVAVDLGKAPVVLMFGHPEWQPDLDERLAVLVARAELLWDRQGWLSRSPAPGPAPTLRARAQIALGNTAEHAAAWEVNCAEIDLTATPEQYDAWVIKDGPWGVHLRESGSALTSLGAYRVRPRSAIGSGDVFAGALAAARAAGASLSDGCRAGTLAAAEALVSRDPLHPDSLVAASLRPAIPPSRRSQMRGEVRASPRWAVGMLAADLERALGFSVDAGQRVYDETEAVELVVSEGSRSVTAVSASATTSDDLVELLVLEGIEGVVAASGAH